MASAYITHPSSLLHEMGHGLYGAGVHPAMLYAMWTSGADATDHNERTWEADYDQGIRGSHGNGEQPTLIATTEQPT